MALREDPVLTSTEGLSPEKQKKSGKQDTETRKNLEFKAFQKRIEGEIQSFIQGDLGFSEMEKTRLKSFKVGKDQALVIGMHLRAKDQGTFEGGKTSDDLYCCLPYAKVIKVGEHDSDLFEESVKEGDHLRFWDHKAISVNNPAFYAWTNNEYSNSSATKVGDPPPKIYHWMIQNYRKYTCFLDPRKAIYGTLQPRDYFTYLLPLNEFVANEKDLEWMIK